MAEIIDESPDEVALFRAGKTKLRKVLMGRCMKGPGPRRTRVP